jgi:hypothetical protein
MSAHGFDGLAEPLDVFVTGGLRRDCVDQLVRTSRSLGDALGHLRLAMRTHTWNGDGRRVCMARAVQAADALTRHEGFHALNDWDGIADHVNVEIIPVDVLDFVRRVRGDDPPDSATLAILVDYYGFHVLSLLALRAWDTPDPDHALGLVGGLLDRLQGPDGSGQPFVADPETLLLIATSHYEPDERGYHSLLAQVRTLCAERQRAVALGHASCMGAHLRFGFHATYARSTEAMRNDNVADYPWLHFAAGTVLEAIEQHKGDHSGASLDPSLAVLAEALFGSLTADTASLLDAGPFRERLSAQTSRLQAAFDALEPHPERYSPLSLFFNFSHNVLKGTIVDALLRADPWMVSFNDLLMGAQGGVSPLASREALAVTLMGHARRHPQRIRGQLTPVIVYDPASGHAVYRATASRLAS